MEDPTPPRPDQIMDYDAILSTQRELSPENIKSAGDLIEISMQILKLQEIDKKNGFKSAFIMTRKITGNNFLTRKVDANGNRFYVLIRDLKAGDEFSDNTKGLIVDYKKVGPNLEPISEGMWSLPRDRRFAEDRYLWDMKDKKEDWKIVDELVQDLKVNEKVYKKAMFIEEELYNKRTR